MTRSITLEDRIAQWFRAFEAVRAELTTEQMRTILATMTEVEGVAQLRSYMDLAGAVMANDREAAAVASRLVMGVRPPGDESE